MSDKTTNYNFDTPGLDGAANIEVQDANWEKADTAIAAKVDKVAGKGLSTNDYTDSEKAEVANIKDKVDKADVLTKTNTAAFTPTGNYHPATKKYVDDKVNTKVDKVSGKGLSTNDFTSEYKTKLDNLDTNLNAKVINGSTLSSLTLTVSTTIPTTLAAGTICFIPEA